MDNFKMNIQLFAGEQTGGFDQPDQPIKYVGQEALQELVTKMKEYTDNKEITLDNTVTQNSSNGVKSSGIYSALAGKQDTLVSGTNIKTVNGVSLLGSGNIDANDVKEITTATNMWELDTGIYNGNVNLFYYKQGYDLFNGLSQNETATVIIDKWITNNGTTTLYFAVSGGVVFSGTADATWGTIYSLTLKATVVKTDIVDNLNTERSDLPLSAKMGKVLNTTLNTKQNTLTFDSAPTNSSTNPVTSGGVYTALSGKQDVLTFDTTPTSSSTNPVTSGGIYTALDGKVDKITGKGLSTDDFVSTNYYTKTQVDGMVSAVYKPAGSVAFASLPTLAASVLGNVYNVTNAFTTTSDFVEGSGNSYPAGTNVVVISPSSGTYKFDVLAGFVDLSGYVPTTRKVNNKALSSDITLNASDVGALPSNTTYVSSVNGSSGAITGMQTTGNLVTSFNSTTSDSKYPSEKLVKTSLDAKQDSMTAITTAEVDALFS